MKLNNLQPLRELKELEGVPSLKALLTKKTSIAKSNLSQIEIISYSVKICLFTARILRNEITIKNRDKALSMALKEVVNLNKLLAKDNYYEETITHKEAKEVFKRIGLKPRHIKT